MQKTHRLITLGSSVPTRQPGSQKFSTNIFERLNPYLEFSLGKVKPYFILHLSCFPDSSHILCTLCNFI